MRLIGAAGLLCLGAGSIVSCGSRTELKLDDGIDVEPPEECLFDEDCKVDDRCRPPRCVDGQCQAATAPLECDDGDACTHDECDSHTGDCVFTPITHDEDGDGFRGPRVGFAPGSPGACGDDCDDTSDRAFPGGEEVCDGVDNDCNGVVDDGSRYDLVNEEPFRLSNADDSRSGIAGLAYDGQRWAATLWGEVERREFRFLPVTGAGELGEAKRLTNHNGGSYGGPLAWTGSFYGVVWSDSREDQTIEAFFNRLDRNGDKLGPDLRLSHTSEFSTNASVRYNGNEFLAFWDDADGLVKALWVQRITLGGDPVGEPARVSPEGLYFEYASLDFGTERVGLAGQSTTDLGDSTLVFMTTTHDFSGPTPLITLDADPDSHQVRFLGDRFIVVWGQNFGDSIGNAIYAATFDEYGNPIQPKTAVATSLGHARGPSLLPLGDRSLLFWSDDSEGNLEIYVKTIDNQLNELSPPARLTFADGSSVGATPAFGPDSQVGVAFDDYRDGGRQAYMLRLGCGAGN